VSTDEVLPVKISAPDLCGRFTGRVIRGLNARAATPEWMKRRLERSGQRSVSALVDISNYVMLEVGRRRTCSTWPRSTAASTCAGAARANRSSC
jgi:phenylalanyl-tRNA synthetase beta chain